MLQHSFDLDQAAPRPPARDKESAADRLAALFSTLASEKRPLPPAARYDFSVIETRARLMKAHRRIKPAGRQRKFLVSGLGTVAAAAVLLLLAGNFFTTGGSARPYTLLSWQGQPTITVDGKEITLRQGMSLRGRIDAVTKGQDSLRLSAGIAQIYLASGSKASLEPVVIAQGGTSAEIRLHAGLAAFDVQQAKWKQFRVQAGNGLIQVAGTRFAIRVDDKSTHTLVARGAVSVQTMDAREKLHLNAGQGGIVVRNTVSLIRDAGNASSLRSARLAMEQFEPRRLNNTLKQNDKKTPAANKLPQGELRVKKAVFSEQVHLKDGTVITGRIISQTEQEILIQTPIGKLTIAMANIRRIVYAK
jgi:ferric-dicitrate binding protein FerR (iron transport regulator)